LLPLLLQNKAIVAAQDQGNNYQCDLRSGLLTSNKPCIKASAVPFTYQVKVTGEASMVASSHLDGLAATRLPDAAPRPLCTSSVPWRRSEVPHAAALLDGASAHKRCVTFW
jgi:hypothetical protein